jgi:NAD(P)-dependent dehydrogenase (short-subunit alcohol dehydrogenase family)
MEEKLHGKVAIVTGSGQGIGKAAALLLAQNGARVVVADIKEKEASETAEAIQEQGAEAMVYRINLAEVSEIRRMADSVAGQWDRIDILVNSAGVVQSKRLLEITEEEWDRVIDINQKGLFFCMQAVGEQMLKRVPEEVKRAGRSEVCYGKMVNLSSISGRRGRDVQPHYAASKAAIISLTQSAALAFAPYNINVNAISPSVVLTPMWEQVDRERSQLAGGPAGSATATFIERIPLKRPGSVEDMAHAILFLCSPESDYITGQTLNVDGGFEMD